MRIIPFHRHDYSSLEIKAVTKVLRSDWITGGPENIQLEKDISRFTKVGETLMISSATDALFLSLKLFGIKPGDEVITTPLSFAATANVICQCGAVPVFADIGSDYNLSPESAASKITSRTKAIIAMDYGGYPCDYQSLRRLPIPFRPENRFQEALGRPLILADSAHGFGTFYKPAKTQTKDLKSPFSPHHHYADIHCYSFHAVKNITSGEGGAATIMDSRLHKSGFGKHLRHLRLHGMTKDAYQRKLQKSFFYNIEEIGYKANLTEMAAALLRTQLKRITDFRKKKSSLKKTYDSAFKSIPGIHLRPPNPLWEGWQVHPHLYTLEWEGLRDDFDMKKKKGVFSQALNKGISLNFHYFPIPLLGYYQKLGYSLKELPKTRKLYPCLFSLPFYSRITKMESAQVISVVKDLVQKK